MKGIRKLKTVEREMGYVRVKIRVFPFFHFFGMAEPGKKSYTTITTNFRTFPSPKRETPFALASTLNLNP